MNILVYKQKWFSNKDLNIKKNEKINFIKVILKLEFLIYKSIYIYVLFDHNYIRRAILTQTNPKKGQKEKKRTIYIYIYIYMY